MYSPGKSLFLLAIAVFLTLLAGGLSQPAHAADGPLWIQRYDGGSYDYSNAMVVDSSGNVYVTGYSSNGFDDDIVTVKYDTNGNQVWLKTYDGGGYETAYAIALDSSGNVYVAGYGSNGATSAFLTIKYGSDGTLAWTRFYNAPGYEGDQAAALAVDSSGNIYVTGYSSYDNSSEFSIGDFSTVKYDPNGALVWEKQYRKWEGSNNVPSAIALDSSGNVYVFGYSCRNILSLNNFDIAIVKYDANGTLIWNRLYDGGGDDFPTAMAVDSAGNVYVTGYSYGSANGDPITVKYDTNGSVIWQNYGAGPIAVDSSGNVYVAGRASNGANGDIATMKYDANGALVWERFYDAGGEELANAIAVDSSGNVCVTGRSRIGSNDDIATVKYDTNGNRVWAQLYDGGGDELAIAIAVDSSGNVYVTGFSQGQTDSDFVTMKYPPQINTPPTLMVPATAGVNIGCPVTFKATATDPGDQVTFSKVSGPAWATVSADGDVLLNPPSGTVGTFTVAVRATDSHDAFDQKSISVTVCPIIIDGVKLSKKNGVTTVQFDVRNTDGTTVSMVSLNSSTLRGIATSTSMPVTITQLKKGASRSVSLKFTGVLSGQTQFVVNGTSSAGPVNANITVPAP